jgi:LuxR family maltose regulon positive regulatory protein
LAAYIALRKGDQKTAWEWAWTISADARVGNRSNDPVIPILIDILLAHNTPASLARAHDVLAIALDSSQRQFDHHTHYEALVWLARMRCAQNRHAEALDAMADAVAFAQPRGILRWFAEGGQCVQELLAQQARTGQQTKEAQAVLAAINQPPSLLRVSDGAPHRGDDLDPLTDRECELLELLAAKLSNKEIAARLKISPHTVRNHTHQIYGKLQVASRREAVQQARAHGLIR